MCYGGQRLPSKEALTSRSRSATAAANENTAVLYDLRDRLAETEARLERVRAREADLSQKLEEMKRFISVMEILENFLRRRYLERRDQFLRLYSATHCP
ncbi:unnamed protein product [Cuscuta campestris]|uniref:Protein SKIP34 n=1 Tax=Cuscuta campestris TaxID=132261 RepID=A0A484N4Y0_9ASTE|nr:unnamed protein product [Cuscuta campestris]